MINWKRRHTFKYSHFNCRILSDKNSELEFKTLQISFKDIEAENKKLLDRISELETIVANDSYLKKENERNLLKISEFEQQLKELEEINGNILKDKTEIENKILLDQDLFSENKKLLEENLKHVSRIAELDNKLEETLSDLNLLKSTGMGASINRNLDGWFLNIS